MACKFLSSRPLTVWIFLILMTACSPSPQETPPQGPEVYFPIRVGSIELELQLAIHPHEQAQGLMYREALEHRHGMLFVFDKPEERNFWMRNTRIPLDLGYFDARGSLLEIHRLYPHDERMVRSRSLEIQFALELEQGQMKALGIQPGDQLDLATLAAALRARGINPKTRLHH
jgi:uncharacterized membrane protein (UPF0127 family)